MKGRFLLNKKKSGLEPNIYTNKSGLILEWILTKGIEKKEFSLSEVAKEKELSLGLVQKVFSSMVNQGYLKTKGVRTSKRFIISRPKDLLESWTNHYNIVKKCKMWNYSSGFENREELEKAILNSKNNYKVVKALHSSAEALQCKHTNLDTLELYLIEGSQRRIIEEELSLKHRERGYEILLIEPYYKKMVLNSFHNHQREDQIAHTPPILTYIDLFHFPLRGLEQAEYLSRKLENLRKINGK